MRTTTPATIQRHVLPGEAGGDTAWFHRQNGFEQQETFRQVAFKRSHWPPLPDGQSSQRPTYTYPHILPTGHERLAFCEPLVGAILSYLDENDIALHSEVQNLKSSQAACLNFLFPLRQDLDLARSVLRLFLPGLREVTRIEFEYTGPPGATEWLGEPKRGKRGQSRTSIDVAIFWMNSGNAVTVDGSQITPSKDVSLPVGVVQTGWFVNPHDGDRGYVRAIHFEVLAPDKLADEDEEVLEFSDWRVNARRFVLECEKLVEIMQATRDAAARSDVAKPVCFFDGSLVISFVQHMLPERQQLYVDAVMDLLVASEACRVPLVGYVDTSYANDLAAMLDALTGRRTRQRISDGALLRSRMNRGGIECAYER